jgi:hypothetical protein
MLSALLGTSHHIALPVNIIMVVVVIVVFERYTRIISLAHDAHYAMLCMQNQASCAESVDQLPY